MKKNRPVVRPRILLKKDWAFCVASWGNRYRLPLTSFLKRLRQTLVFSSPLLPGPGVRFYAHWGQQCLLVYEEPPGQRTIRIRYKKERGYFTLALPYVIFIPRFIRPAHANGQLALNHLSVYFRTKPLASLKDKLLYPPLPNIEGKAKNPHQPDFVCQHDYLLPGLSLAQAVEQVLTHFWQDTFLEDEMQDDYFNYYRRSKTLDRRLRSFLAWQTASERNPLFVLQAKWWETRLTLDRIIDYLISDSTGKTEIDFPELSNLFLGGP